MDYLILIKVLVIYISVLVIMKFMGKREIGQLSLFDFVVILVIADIAVAGIDSDISFYLFIVGIVFIALIQKLLALILLKFPKIRNFIDGTESVIIYEGKLNIKEMKKQSYNIDDLIIQYRIKNIRSLSEIRFAILEANGELSIFKYSDYESNSGSNQAGAKTRTISAETMTQPGQAINNQNNNFDQSKGNEILPFPLIISGVISQTNLKILNLKEEWLQNEIKVQGYQDSQEVYYANYENNHLFIMKICDF